MNQRERILVILVGGLIVLGAGQWGFSKYKAAVKDKKDKLESLRERQLMLSEKQLLGAMADRQMGEYMVRSVSSDPEQARSDYQAWLFDVVEENDINSAKVVSQRVLPVGDLYRQMSFTLTGQADLPEVLSLVHDVQAMDYLHRIRELEIKPNKNNAQYSVELSIDVASLTAAPEKPEPPETQAWRVEPELVAYSEPILNRNLFEPPNRAPSYNGQRTLEATVGRDEAFPLDFKDPEGDQVEYQLVDASEKATIDETSGTLRVQSSELEEFEVTVRATDRGYPHRSTEETLLVKVVEPPPPPMEEPEPVEPEFDDARQTYLTGLVQGANDWTAWMNVRTRGKTLKLRVGDEFEVGSVRGVVRAIDADHVEIDLGDRTVSVRTGSTLKAAVDGE
jgi:hypothetical protein